MSPVMETLVELVRINSVNPEWDGPGEHSVACWLTGCLESNGIGFTTQAVLPGRENVIARLPGRDSSRSIVLEAHMDTVSAAGMSIDPFAARIENGRLWGRGACDTKAGLAAMLHALLALSAEGKQPAVDVVLAVVVDEENAYRGVTAYIESLRGGARPEAAIVAEPTELRVVRANKGVLRWRIIAHGRAAHSSTPASGASAISAMADVIKAIEGDRSERVHDLVGAPTCSIGTIQGGRQVNFVPDHCVITLDRRLLPGESGEAVIRHYDSLLNAVRENHSRVRIECEAPFLLDEAMETPADAAVVTTAARVLESIGLTGVPVGVPFGCDCTKLSRAGIPAVIFGPGSIAQAHTAEEFVEVAQVETAFDFYRRFLLEFGNP